MQQDTYIYPNFPQDPRFQYRNTNFPVQLNTLSWSDSYIPDASLSPAQSVPNPFGYGNQLHPNVPTMSGTVYGTTPTLSWAHTVPSLMPWVTQGETSVPDPIVRFTAPFPPDPCTSQTATSWELLNNLGANKTNANMHLKRKSDLEVIEPEAPHKLCITEERMAARMNELHISNRYSVPAGNSSFGPYGSSSYTNIQEKSVTNLQELEAMLKESNSDGKMLTKSLILAPEIKKLVEPEKIFASTFLDKVERPSMAVVLWQPQNKLLPNASNPSDTKSEDEKESDSSSSFTHENNNNFISEQLNVMRNMNQSFVESANTASTSDDVMDT